jgi:outer membrane lipoprotein-sorting protein
MRKRGFFLVFLLFFAIGLTVIGCQPAHIPSPASAPEAPGVSAISNILRSREGSLQGLQGVADLKLSSPAGSYRGKEILAVELPNRFRVESTNFMGFSDLVLCSDGENMDLYLPSEGKIIRGRPTPEDLAQISGARIPLPQVLRVFMGLPPFPLDEKIASSLYLGKSEEPLLEWKGAGTVRQHLWIDERAVTVREGEVLDGGEVWFSFRFADYREVAGFLIPFSLEIQMRKEGVGIHLTYRDIKPNPVIEKETFRLALSSFKGLTILDLESKENAKDPLQ